MLPVWLLLAAGAFAQAGFFKTYGKTPQDYAYSLHPTAGGGFLLSGVSNSYGGSNYLFMTRTNALGDTSWMKGYVTGNTFFGYSSTICNDSSLVVCGLNGFARFDSNGYPLWNFVYTGVTFYSVQQTFDGGYILAGSIGSTSSSNGIEAYLLKTDSNGIKQWSRKLGGPADEYANCIRQTADSGYIFVGVTNSFGAGGYDLYVVKTHTNGDTAWTHTYGGTQQEGGTSSIRQTIERTLDGGFILCGYTSSFVTAGGADAYAVKIDGSGSLQWSKAYGGSQSDAFLDVKQCADSGYVFGGYTGSFGGGAVDAYLVRTDKNGDTLFTHAYGGGLAEYGQSIALCADKGFGLAGYTASYGSGNNDAFLVKTDSLGNTSCHQYSTATVVSNAATQVMNTNTGKIFITLNTSSPVIPVHTGGNVTDACLVNGIEAVPENELFHAFPNPSAGMMTFTSDEEGEIEISNMLGNTVYRHSLGAAGTLLEIDMRTLSAGAYNLHFSCKSGATGRKIVLLPH